LVRLGYRAGWAVNEARLDCAPGFYEAPTIACRERPDVKRFDALRTLLELGLRIPPVAVLLDGTIVFRNTELIAQTFSPAFSLEKERGDSGNQNHGKSND
jgi:hypothetical protein